MRKNSIKKRITSIALMLIVMLLTVAPAFADASMNEATNAINNNKQMINLPFVANSIKWLGQAVYTLRTAGIIIGVIGIIIAAIVFIFAGDNIGAAVKKWILGILAGILVLSSAAQIISMFMGV